MVYTDHNFLMADSVRELHQFAKQIGIPSTHFYRTPFPHYELPPSEIQKAIERGAQYKNIVEMIQQHFKTRVK